MRLNENIDAEVQSVMKSCTVQWLLSDIVCLLLFGAANIALAQNPNQSVRDSVDAFCNFEFNGAQDPSQRAELAQFSDSRLADLKKRMGDINPYLFEWQASPLDVIESFKVSKISVSGLQAYADVEYLVVARRESPGGPITSVARNFVHSQLQLRQVRARWRVFDPPYAKVSRIFLSTSYRGLFQLPETWYQHASRAQLLWLRNALDNILLLDSLDVGPQSR
jgi:hypothetical protein